MYLLVMNGEHSLQDLLLYCVDSVNSVNVNNNGIRSNGTQVSTLDYNGSDPIKDYCQLDTH
jgi:hypothetical protein